MNKLLRLSAAEYLLLLAAAVSVGVARLALWVVPFRVVARVGERRACRASKPFAPEKFSPQRVAWAVMVASRPLGKEGLCLVRALAARWMLAALGNSSELRIGVAKSADGKFLAHAWLESNGKILIGEVDGQSFTALPPFTVEHP
jgi:hypothetical protein